MNTVEEFVRESLKTMKAYSNDAVFRWGYQSALRDVLKHIEEQKKK